MSVEKMEDAYEEIKSFLLHLACDNSFQSACGADDADNFYVEMMIPLDMIIEECILAANLCDGSAFDERFVDLFYDMIRYGDISEEIGGFGYWEDYLGTPGTVLLPKIHATLNGNGTYSDYRRIRFHLGNDNAENPGKIEKWILKIAEESLDEEMPEEEKEKRIEHVERILDRIAML